MKKVSLFETLDSLSSPIESLYPKKMEELGQGYGYLLYVRKQVGMRMKNAFESLTDEIEPQLFIDGKRVATQYQTEIGEDIFYQGEKKSAL